MFPTTESLAERMFVSSQRVVALAATTKQDEATMNQSISAETGAMIPKPNLARELGVSSRTLSRWLADATVEFPRPVAIRNRLYFARASVEAWKAARLRASIKMEVA
jgi:predicted DNA-binding transcriptional regulator AlpA